MWWRVVACGVVWCGVVSCRVVSCRVVSCRVVSYHVVPSCLVSRCLVLPCLVFFGSPAVIEYSCVFTCRSDSASRFESVIFTAGENRNAIDADKRKTLDSGLFAERQWQEWGS